MDEPTDPGRAPVVGAEPAADAGALAGVDVGRRSFFRRMAGELVQGAATLTGVATVAQGAVEGAAAATRELAAGTPAVALDRGTPPDLVLRDAIREGLAPWVDEGSRRLVLDQRRLPGTVATFPVAAAPDAARAIAERVVSGPSAAMLAAWALARTMENAAGRAEAARTALVIGAQRSLLAADPGSHVLRWAIRALVDATVDLPAAGDATETAAALERQLRSDHARLAAAVADALEGVGARSVLLHGPGGALWGAGAGVSVDAVLDAGGLRVAGAGPAVAGRPSVAVTEGRPWLDGARLVAWELVRRGAAVTLLTEGAATGALLQGRCAAVVSCAERVASDGSVSVAVGALGLALAAQRAGVPFVVAVAPWAIDSVGAPDAAALVEPSAPPAAIVRIAGTIIAPAEVDVDTPRFDVVPASLITRLVALPGDAG